VWGQRDPRRGDAVERVDLPATPAAGCERAPIEVRDPAAGTAVAFGAGFAVGLAKTSLLTGNVLAVDTGDQPKSGGRVETSEISRLCVVVSVFAGWAEGLPALWFIGRRPGTESVVAGPGRTRAPGAYFAATDVLFGADVRGLAPYPTE